jgi:hypothetical protein
MGRYGVSPHGLTLTAVIDSVNNPINITYYHLTSVHRIMERQYERR